MPNWSKFTRLAWPKFVFTVRFFLTDKVFWQFVCLKNQLLLKCENCSCMKPPLNKTFPVAKSICQSSLTGEFCESEMNCLCGKHRQLCSECYYHQTNCFLEGKFNFKSKHSIWLSRNNQSHATYFNVNMNTFA